MEILTEKMVVFDIADFSQDAAKVLTASLTDEVIVNNNDGKSYQILPVTKKGKSPFEGIPCITADITTQEIVELIRESRAGI